MMTNASLTEYDQGMTPDALDRFIREAATALDLDPSSVPPTEEGFSDLLARIVAERDGALYEASAAKGRVAVLASERDAWKESCANVTLAARDARDAGKSDGRRELWMEIVGAVAGPLNARPDELLLAGPERGVSMLVETIHSAVAQRAGTLSRTLERLKTSILELATALGVTPRETALDNIDACLDAVRRSDPRTKNPDAHHNLWVLGRREMFEDVAAELAPILDVKPEQIDSLDRLADLMRNWLTEQVDASAPSARAITDECSAIREMLLKKNAAYGDSALAPVRIFSKASPVEQILVRLDDKLSRLARGSAAGEDVVLDLVGYLILLRIAQRREREEMLRAPTEVRS